MFFSNSLEIHLTDHASSERARLTATTYADRGNDRSKNVIGLKIQRAGQHDFLFASHWPTRPFPFVESESSHLKDGLTEESNHDEGEGLPHY